MKSLLFFNLISLLVALIAGKAVENAESQVVKATFNYHNNKDLDVYYEEALINEKRPVVIHVHGGGWAEGSKDGEGYIGEFFNKNGFVAVTVDYRLYPETEFIDDMVEDVYNSIQWTINNISKFGGDASQLTLTGHSAGAHLITLTTVKAALGMTVNGITLQPYHLKQLISINGPHEFNNTDEEILANAANLREYSKLSPELAFLANYAGAQEHLFYGKSGYDQVKILEQYADKSIEFLGSEKYTFIECEEDTTVVLGSADPMIKQLNRTVVNVTIDHKIYPGDHMGVLDKIKAGDAEMENELLTIVNSVF